MVNDSTKGHVDFSVLTSKQKKVFHAIETYINSKGIPPTVREIGEMMGEKTPGAVQGILNRLEQKGVIKREVGMARSIQLVSDTSQYLAPIYIPEIKKVTARNVNELLNMYNINAYHPFSPNIVVPGQEYFILSCPDDSLIKSGLKYEDLLIMSKNNTFSDNDVVLVLYDNHVLLRYYQSGQQKNTVILKADINLLGKEVFDIDEVKIIAKLVWRVTKY